MMMKKKTLAETETEQIVRQKEEESWENIQTDSRNSWGRNVKERERDMREKRMHDFQSKCS